MENLDFEQFTMLHEAARKRDRLDVMLSSEDACDSGLIERYFMDDLDDDETAQLEAHRQTCAGCRGKLDALKELSNVFAHNLEKSDIASPVSIKKTACSGEHRAAEIKHNASEEK